MLYIRREQDAYDDINSLVLGSDPSQLKKYIKKCSEKNDVKTTVEPKLHISLALYAKMLKCQANSESVERSFSLLKSILCANRNFTDTNIVYVYETILQCLLIRYIEHLNFCRDFQVKEKCFVCCLSVFLFKIPL